MKKVLTILLLASLMTTNSELQQLWKLPVLVHHYFEHIEWDNDASVIDFIVKHYGESPQNDNTHNAHSDHENLPFKTHKHNFVSVFSIDDFKNIEINFSQKPCQTFIEHSLLNLKVHIPVGYQGNIWQPPRLS